MGNIFIFAIAEAKQRHWLLPIRLTARPRRETFSSYTVMRVRKLWCGAATVTALALPMLVSCSGVIGEPHSEHSEPRSGAAAPSPLQAPVAVEASPTAVPAEDAAQRDADRPPAEKLPKPESSAAAARLPAGENDGSPDEARPAEDPAGSPPPSADALRLRQLAVERANAKPDKSYRIGPGDLLEIDVFDVPEMNRKVRVATSGFVQLPLIGAVQAAGRTESALAREIAARLSTNYVQDPQVDVFVEEYKSQEVAVTGSVAKPGLYPLTKDRYTVLDMLSEAGGLTKDAGAVIEFIPAKGGGERSAAFEVASAGAPITSARGALEPSNETITLDLTELLRGGNHGALSFPVAAGDVIYVPEAGSFTIEGWVDKPGTYPITRRMTVLAALSAGGGPLLPSKLGSVRLLRARNDSGDRDAQVIDLRAIRDGKAPDVELRSGDIVRVPGNVALMVPWGFYSFVKGLISIGASFPLF